MKLKDRWQQQYNECRRQWDDICYLIGDYMIGSGLFAWYVYGLYQFAYCPAFRESNPPGTFWNVVHLISGILAAVATIMVVVFKTVPFLWRCLIEYIPVGLCAIWKIISIKSK